MSKLLSLIGSLKTGDVVKYGAGNAVAVVIPHRFSQNMIKGGFLSMKDKGCYPS
jgi:hypothetical protein